MSKEFKRDERANQILDLIRQGHTTNDEILGALARLPEQRKRDEGRWGMERGSLAEQRVAGLIQELSYVSDVQITEPHSEDNRLHRDIIVTLDANSLSLLGFSTVGIQVKASYMGISAFKDKLQNRMEQSQEELVLWLNTERLILVKTDDVSDRGITDEFESQLNRIIGHCTAGKESLESVFPWRA